MHKLLQRQLKRHIGSAESIPEAWQSFIEAMDKAYHQADADRARLERALDSTSQELLEKNQQIQQQIMAEQERARLVEEQGRALLDVVQTVALGDLDVQVEIPEGVEVLSELAIGIEMMVDDIREMMVEQEQARTELEGARQQVESALQEVLAVQRRYLRGEWEDYTGAPQASQGYFRSEDGEGPTSEAWLPAMTAAVRQVQPVTESDEQQDVTLAVPIHLHGQVIGALGLSRPAPATGRPTETAQWSPDEIAAVEDIVEQVAWALENQRLFDEAQQANFVMGTRVKALDCLNDIGRKIDEAPLLPEFLEWVAGRIPSAMQHPDGCLATIEYDGQLYGSAEAVQLPRQMVGGLRIGGERVGQVTIAYTEEHDFLDAESALLGDIVRRVSGYIENRRLVEQTQDQLANLATIQETTSALTAALTFDEAIKALLPQVASVVQADTVSMFLFEGEYMTRVGKYPDGDREDARVGQAIPLADYPLTRQVIETRQPLALTADDPRLQEHARQAFKAAGVTANATIPLVGRESILGTLAISLHQPGRAFTEGDIQVLQTLADQAAIAIENARLFEQTQATLLETEALYQASAELNAAQTYDGILAALRQHTLVGQGASAASLVYFDRPWTSDPPAPARDSGETPDWINYLTYWSKTPLPLKPRYPLSAFPSAPQVLRPDAPTLIEDAATYPLWDESDRTLFVERFGARSAMFFPMVVRGQWIGYINAVYDKPTQFPEADVRRLMALSAQTAVAVQSLRQLEEIQARAHSEQQLRQVIAIINASEDLIADLPVIAQHLRELAPAADVMALTSYTPGKSEFTYFAANTSTESDPSAQTGASDSVQQDNRLPLKGSGPEWVIAHKEPWLGADIHQEQSFVEDEQLVSQGVFSRLLLPLQIGERVIGTLNLGSAQPGAFTKEHVPILSQVADQIALALERARLLEETRAALAEAEATHRRYLREEWEGMLSTPDRVWGYLDGLEGLTAADEVWTPEIEQAVATGELTTVAEPINQPTSQPTHRTALAIPLRLRGQTIGVLDFYDNEHTWTEDDKALVEALADQVAQALETQRLFEQTQRRASRERLTGEIMGKIRAAGDVRDILETAAGELGRVLGVSHARVRLGEPTVERETQNGKRET